MGSFLSRLFQRLRPARQRQHARRRLRIEALENRRLMVNDLATITGTVFTDLTENGLTGDDTLQSGATVRLYRDGGNSTFDNGGADDTLVNTATTNASGVYSFNNLIAGRYYVQQLAITGLLQRATQTVQTVVVSANDAAGVAQTTIDTFDTTAQIVTGSTTGVPVSSALAASEAIGGERDLFVNLTSASGSIELNVDTSTANVLEFIASTTGTGARIITYDGADGDATTIAGTGLGGVDLTASGAVGIRFRIGADQINGDLTIRIYSGSGNFSTATVSIPNTGGTASEEVVVRFSDFAVGGGTGATFTNVGAIQLEIAGAAAVDGQLDLVATASPTTFTNNMANLNPMSLGNLVWADRDNDGAFDTGELGIASVTVQLYADSNSNGSYDSGTDTLQDTAVTDANGLYLFDDLLPGNYIVVVPSSQFGSGQALFGHVTSTGNDPAPDPDGDVNNDDNGAAVSSDVASQTITLAAGGEPTNDGDSDANTNLTLDLGFVPQIDLQISKTDSPDPVVAGNNLTYTLSITNNGPLPATGVVVTDVLPAGVTFVSANSNAGTVSEASGTVTGNVGNLAVSGTATITIIVTVPSSRTTSISNTATITGNEFDTNSANNTSSSATAVTQQTDLAITKTDAPDPVTSAGTLTYTLTVTNNGPSDATGVTVTDVLPSGITFVSATASQGTATNASGTITGALGNITSGASATITVAVTVDAATVGPIANTATVTGNETDTNTGNNSASSSTTVTRQVDLAITKTDSVDPAVPGGQLTYTITVTNNGPSTATNVSVTDVLPSGLTFSSASASQGTATHASGTITGSLGTIASGGNATITLVVDVSASASGSITNTSTVTATETETNSANNTATQVTTLTRSADLAITKSDTPDPVVAGQTITYTLTVTNNGPSDASGVTVTDTLPSGVTFVSATPSQGTATGAGNTVTASLGNLADGASATITITGTVAATASGTLTNTATVSATETDSVSTNNSDSEDTTVQRQVDLAITKIDATDPISAGNALTYTMTVTNNGPSQATNVSLSDVLPSGVTFTSVTSSQGTASHASGTVTASLGNLNPSSSATVTLIVGVSPTTRGTLTNTATVTATETETNSTNNSATATTTVNGTVDLAITKSDSSDPVAAGGSLTYTIVVTNNGPSTATNVSVADTLPSGLTFTSATSTVGTVTNVGNVITGSIGTLAPAATATITVIAAVSSNATGTLTNTATVTATETESNSSNNSASQQTTIAVPGSISGVAYVDANRNNTRDTGESGIAGVLITLTGTNLLGSQVNTTQTTDANGEYTFSNLLPGTYTLTETQPSAFNDGSTNVGVGAGGTAGTNTITQVVLPSGTNATVYNFGEVRRAMSKRRFLASSTGNE